MGKPDSLAWVSLALAIGVGSVAMILGLRLCWERRTREGGLPEPDRRHFLLQDLRRGFGVGLMAFLAVGIYLGSRVPAFVVEPGRPVARRPAPAGDVTIDQPKQERHPNRIFLALWLGVFAAVVALLLLAMADWFSTRRYALRHRRQMDRERAEILREALRRSGAEEDENPDGPPRSVSAGP